MTLFKQMALAISVIIITMLGSVMYINYVSAKKDMIESLYETTVNNISSLSSHLAEAADEEAHVTTVIDAAFDSGYYKLIEFTSDNFSYKQVDNEPVEGVPAWFINNTNIEIETIKEDVSSGWNIIGEVKVAGDTAIVYSALYKMFIKLVYLFIIFVVGALIILSIMLSFILKPLKEIQRQAEAIMKNEFLIQEKEPYTTEFKEVVKGMNAMVKKVEEIFEKGNEAAKRNRELLYNDPITKLFNRRYLMLKLPDLISLENRANGGTIMFAAIRDAQILNQALGRKDADEMFFKLAEIFKNSCKEYEDGVIARVNGTEFTIMLPNCEASNSITIANTIHKEYESLLSQNGLNLDSVILDIGMYRYRPNVTISELLTRADNALTQAKMDEISNTYIYEEKDDEDAMGKEEWRAIIEEAISKKQFSLKFWPTMDAKTKETNHKVMTFTIDGGENKRYFYGDFIAPAINLGLVSKIYIVALRDLITKQHGEIKNSICSIRLSNEFIRDPLAFENLSALLREHAKSLNFKLSFEVSDNFSIHNTAMVKGYVELFKQYGFSFGINSFTGESSDFSYLKELNPTFIKADTSFLLDQSKDSMSALQVITDSLGIDIISTFVKTQEELNTLNSMHVYKVQGPITDTIK